MKYIRITIHKSIKVEIYRLNMVGYLMCIMTLLLYGAE